MLLVDAGALQFVTYVDEHICNRNEAHLAIPYECRFRAVIDVYADWTLTRHTIRHVTEGRWVYFVEFRREMLRGDG